MYIVLISLTMICGVGLAMIHGFILNPDPKPLNATELQSKFLVQSQVLVPQMERIFPLLTIFNIGVAFIIFMFPLYWIWIVKYSSNILTLSQVPLKPTVYFLILFVGHNTFYKSYIALKTIPFPVFLTMYYPHTLIEILAYILAGTFSLLCIDKIREYLQTPQSIQDIHPGDLSLVILNQIWYVFILIGVLLIVSGAIECYITPKMVLDMMKIFY